MATDIGSHCLPEVGYSIQLRYTLLSLASTSILGCLAVFWGFVRMERKPDPLDPSSILLFLSLSDIMLAIVAVLDGANVACTSNQLCLFKAIVSQFFGFSSFLWTAAMSHSSYVTVSQLFLPQTADHTKLMKVYHGICWGVPGFTAILMLLTSTVAPTGYLCSLHTSTFRLNTTGTRVTMDDVQLAMHIVVFFVPLLLVELFNLYVFRFLAKTLRNLPRSNELLIRFTRYLVVVIAIKAVFLVTRMKSIVAPDNRGLVLLVFVVAGPPLQGLGDYLIYSGGREQNRFAQINSHEGNSSTHSALALTSVRHSDTDTGNDDAFMRSSSTRGGHDDDDEEESAGVVSEFYNTNKAPGTALSSGRHSLISQSNDIDAIMMSELDNDIRPS